MPTPVVQDTLRSQIMAFKDLKSGKMLTAHVWETVKPRPLAPAFTGMMQQGPPQSAAEMEAARVRVMQQEAAQRVAATQAAKEAKARLAASKIEKANAAALKKGTCNSMLSQCGRC